jgi:hypothetical protein
VDSMKTLFSCLIVFVAVTLWPGDWALSLDPYEAKRARMVEQDIKARGIKDPKVLQAMGSVPRQCFVDLSQADKAYNDHPLPIGEGQTISQPYVVALMTEALGLKGHERVLEIGTGSSSHRGQILILDFAPIRGVSIRKSELRSALEKDPKQRELFTNLETRISQKRVTPIAVFDPTAVFHASFRLIFPFLSCYT